MPAKKNRDGITSDQSDFIDWLMDPKGTREPKTQKEYAELNHISDRTLTKWKKDTKFREAWDRAYFDLNISPDRVQEIVDSMHAQACRGNMKAAELYLKFTDRFRDVREVITTTQSVEELSDEALEEEYQGYLAQEVARRTAAAAVGPDDDE